jgi:hypothetical protein
MICTMGMRIGLLSSETRTHNWFCIVYSRNGASNFIALLWPEWTSTDQCTDRILFCIPVPSQVDIFCLPFLSPDLRFFLQLYFLPAPFPVFFSPWSLFKFALEFIFTLDLHIVYMAIDTYTHNIGMYLNFALSPIHWSLNYTIVSVVKSEKFAVTVSMIINSMIT